MMQREVRFKQLLIHSKLVPCAHSCKYCLYGDKKLSKLPPSRIIAFIERFLEWKEVRGGRYPVSYGLNYTADYDRPTLEFLKDLEDRYRSHSVLAGITLGGLPWRPEKTLRDWLIERQEFGCKSVHASLAGTGAMHDYWNGRPGNFDLIIKTLMIAGELGMALGARLFVTRSTLPSLQELNNILERLPKHDGNWRYALPFYYAGWGGKLESERIDEHTRDNLPAWLDPLINASAGDGYWRSEREWIAHFETRSIEPIEANLILDVTDENIDRLESMTCDAIVAEYESRTLAAYGSMPSVHELSDRYGDKENRDVYALERCITMKWLDKHLFEHPMEFERQLTHLQTNH